MSTARPTVTTCDHACGERLVAEEGQSPGALDRFLAVAYGMFFLFLAVAGSLWIVADLSGTLLQAREVKYANARDLSDQTR